VAWSLSTGAHHESHENAKDTKKNVLYGVLQSRQVISGQALLKVPEPREVLFRDFRVFVAFVVSAGRQ